MSPNPHFIPVATWADARELLTFVPCVPAWTAGEQLQALAVYVRDHRGRELSPEERSLEAHYGRFAFCQSRPSSAEARRQALEVRYGPCPRAIRVAGYDGHAYELGPEPADDDPDGRSPAVVVWHAGRRFYFLASTSLTADALLRISGSLHA